MLFKLKKLRLPRISLKVMAGVICLCLLFTSPVWASVVDSATLAAKVVAFMEGYSQTMFEQMKEAYKIGRAHV